jgi:hypothetical protein
LYLVYCNKPNDQYRKEVYYTINNINIFLILGMLCSSISRLFFYFGFCDSLEKPLGVKLGSRYGPVNIIKECFGDWQICLNVICSEIFGDRVSTRCSFWSRLKLNFRFHCAPHRWSLVRLGQQETLGFFRTFW